LHRSGAHALVRGVFVLVALLLAAPDAAALRKQGAALLEKHQVKKACRAFEKALALEPANAALLADYGACETALGEKAKALDASLRAALSGEREVRLRAYYNLMRLGRALPHPVRGDGEAHCKTWKSDGACERQLTGCAFIDDFAGQASAYLLSGVAICEDPDEAASYLPTDEAPGLNCSVLVEVSQDEDYCRPDDHGAPCGTCGCDEAPDAKACEEAVENCHRSPISRAEMSCTLVFIDACHSRAGAVCEGEPIEVSSGHDFNKEALNSLFKLKRKIPATRAR
jgi:tetratricopeptide (TPR) repeat protein